IYAGLLVVSAGVYALVLRTGWVGRWLNSATAPAGVRWRAALGWAVVALVLGGGLRQSFIPGFTNNYNRELAKDGLWSLFAAFWSNQLDYDRFYPTMPNDAAFNRMHAL